MHEFILIGNYFGILISLIFFVIFFFTESRLNKARSFVMIGMILFAFSFLFDLLRINGNWTSANIFSLIYLPFLFSIYPLIYHYIVNLINTSEKIIFEKEKFILPVIIFFVTILTLYFFDYIEIKKYTFAEILNSTAKLKPFDFIAILTIILYYLQAQYYLILFIKLQKKIGLRGFKVDKSLYLGQWIKYITFGLVIIELTYIFIFLFPLEATKIDVIISILLVVFLGIVGIKHNEILLNMRISGGFKQHKFNSLTKRKRPSHITDSEIKKILSDMDRIIAGEKLYLDPNLKLKNLARKIHIPEKELSILINDHFNKNFTTYINNFRIEDAKAILKSKNSNYKLDNLFAEVGFFSRSTFNRVFKTTTKITPSEFQKNNHL